jgi:hypothetical protein
MFKAGEWVVIKKPVEGLCEGTPYQIRQIHRSIDGAYDYDDIFLEGVEGNFCEFSFDYPDQNQDKLCPTCNRWVFKAKDKL